MSSPALDLAKLLDKMSLTEVKAKVPSGTVRDPPPKQKRELPPLRSYQSELLAIAEAADVSHLRKALVTVHEMIRSEMHMPEKPYLVTEQIMPVTCPCPNADSALLGYGWVCCEHAEFA